MAPSPLLEQLGAEDAAVLLDIAQSTLSAALRGVGPVKPALADLPPVFTQRRGMFVTLLANGRLNGCVGTMEGTEPVAHEVARLALSAAFEDDRLPPLRIGADGELTIKVSLLSPMRPLAVGSMSELAATVRPRYDGVLVEAGWYRGVFLPAVWEQLPDPWDFLDRLWHKAGLAPGAWPLGLRVHRFTTQQHERRVSGRTIHAGSLR